jgi:HlyD family secretion protein
MVVAQQKDSVLRIEKGPAFNKNGLQDMYLVKDGKALKVNVATGLIGTEYVEITSGLNPGDRIIISDISSFRRRKELDFQEF